MHIEGVFAPDVLAHLADGFQKRQALDVADGAAHFDDQHVGLRRARGQPDAPLDLVGDVRDDLDRAAQKVAAPFLAEHCRVNLTAGDVGELAEVDIDKSLIVAEVKVGFRPVFGDKHFAMLIGRHGAGVNIEIRVKLHGGHAHAARLENGAQRSDRHAFAKAGKHTAGYKDIFGHRSFPSNQK